ncbi:hypothetical protein IMSHALPRED_008242 [Imshaugia aleurites]|uniref:Ceramide glucosyltransferase n=1 Tax=Imshaugia aleurites TaxID=172621 RepID=A0A8H3FTZ5_9LECA|nr:hypothetical protein IMSHALPRED_008242 [Imshaugia aleurites]
MLLDYIAIACLVWYFLVLTVCAIGVFQIRRNYLRPPSPSVSDATPISRVPHVTIIRPVKGIEPYLYECLAATFNQTYPREKLTIYFCISSRNDPAFSTLEQLIADYHGFDVKILVEGEDPNLSGRDGRVGNLGPNPKIRNMSRAYREAKGDIVWIIDCNVWVSPSVAGRMVDLLCGLTPTAPGWKYKFVHQLPLVVDVSSTASAVANSSLSSGPQVPMIPMFPTNKAGGLLDELFLSTSHAKFYIAIATVAIAPCTVGKSNMFRRSHLDALTTPTSTSPYNTNPNEQHQGIDFFSDNICEDHLIGDLLWRSPVPQHVQDLAEHEGEDPQEHTQKTRISWGNHGLLPPRPSNLCTQPVANTSLISYIDRRTRWLRVRKFTVTLATLVEPGTESLLCSAYGAWGLTTLPWCNKALSIPPTWLAFFAIYISSVVTWAAIDRYVWGMLQYGGTAESERPFFGRTRGTRRGVKEWVLTWLGREVLAFPIWAWAFFGGVTVVWRGRKFWVGMDMRVHEIEGDAGDAGKRKD